MNSLLQAFAGLLLIFLFFIFMLGVTKLSELLENKDENCQDNTLKEVGYSKDKEENKKEEL